MDITKRPWESKTMLLNGLAGLALFLALFVPALSGFQAAVTAHATEIGLAWSALNLILRAVTKGRISLTE